MVRIISSSLPTHHSTRDLILECGLIFKGASPNYFLLSHFLSLSLKNLHGIQKWDVENLELRSVRQNHMCKGKIISQTFVEYLACMSIGLVFRSLQRIHDVGLALEHTLDVPMEK